MRTLAISCSLAAILITGCAHQAPPFLVPGLERSEIVSVEDLRPESEAQKEVFSYFITSSAYGIYRIPETASSPSAIRLLTHRAYEKFPELAQNASLKVHHLVTYLNLQSRLRWGAVGAAFAGPIGALATQSSPPAGEVYTTQVDSGIFQQTADDEYLRALYTESENPSRAPVNVIYIETEIMGRRIATRSLAPPLKDKPNPSLAEVVDICIANHLALYSEPVKKTVSSGQAEN